MHYYVIPPPPRYHTNRLYRVQLCWLPVRTYQFLFHTFKVPNGYMRSGPKQYISKTFGIWVLFTFDGYKSYTVIYNKKHFRASDPRRWNRLVNNIKPAACKEVFSEVVKTDLFKLDRLKYINQCIYIWNMFVLYEFRTCLIIFKRKSSYSNSGWIERYIKYYNYYMLYMMYVVTEE